MKIHCQYSKLVPISELKEHPKNRNDHPKDQIQRLAKILQYQGWRYPIKVSNRSGFITSGHGRLYASQLIGWKEVPVSFQDYESDEQEYADLQADNAIASWSDLEIKLIKSDLELLPKDFDTDYLGIFNFSVNRNVVDEKEDEVPEVKESICKLGDIWQLGNHRLMCGDSTDIVQVDQLMRGEKADMAYCDPPYGVDVVGGDKAVGGGKIVKSNRYERVIGDLNPDTAKISVDLVKGLNILNQIWWGAQNYCHALPETNRWLYWQKNQTGDFADGEIAWISGKGSIKRFEHTWAGLIKQSEHKDKRVHPTQKPVALAEWCFETYGRPKIVLDLFGGSGSTLIACENTNRKCFMIELDPHYCDVIIKRWENYTGNKAVRL